MITIMVMMMMVIMMIMMQEIVEYCSPSPITLPTKIPIKAIPILVSNTRKYTLVR